MQLLAEGVTVIVPVIGLTPVFAPVKVEMFPVPLAANPIEVLVFVHAYVAPLVGLVNDVPVMPAPLQTVIFAGTATVGVGFTVIVYVDGVPGQLLAVGVTVIVDVIGFAPVFVAVNVGILPIPLAPQPMDVFVFVQE